MDSQGTRCRHFHFRRCHPTPNAFQASMLMSPRRLPPPPQPTSFAVPSSEINDVLPQQQGEEENRVFPFNSVLGAGGPGAAPNAAVPDGSGGSSPRASGFSIEPPAKKKRGRPRKYAPDGNIALGLSPTPVTPVPSVVGHADSGGGSGTNAAAATAPSSDNQPKKARGRPPGSVKKQLDALGSAGAGFTPHVITVLAGEDIAQKVMAFSQQGPRTVCILSANGAICNVTLRQPASCGGTVTLEGRYEIISLSGSFMLSESDGSRSRSGGLSVSLAGADGKVVGGGVSGMLIAASPVQVVVGSFIADGKKPRRKPSPTPMPTPPAAAALPPPNMLNFGAPLAGGVSSPPSEGGSSESDEENGSGGSPLPLPYSNAGQPIQPMPMYANMGWTNPTAKMLP